MTRSSGGRLDDSGAEQKGMGKRVDHWRAELANVVTHGVGVVAAVAGATVLVVLVSLRGDPWRIVAASVYGVALISLYLFSTLYHAARRPSIKARLKALDHGAIFLLIAGTYTPFTLVTLRGGWGWSLFGVTWGVALVGVVFKLFWAGRFQLLSTLLYIAMGWLVVIAIVPLIRSVSAVTLALLFAGGISYTAGTLFYHNRRIPFAHAIWHLFVLGGSAFHYWAILNVMSHTA